MFYVKIELLFDLSMTFLHKFANFILCSDFYKKLPKDHQKNIFLSKNWIKVYIKNMLYVIFAYNILNGLPTRIRITFWHHSRPNLHLARVYGSRKLHDIEKLVKILIFNFYFKINFILFLNFSICDCNVASLYVS